MLSSDSRLYQHNYYFRNRERIRARVANYYKTHKEAAFKRVYKFAASHPGYTNKYHKELNAVRRLQLFDILGQYKCVKCGYSDRRALHFDHIEGGGRQKCMKMFNGRTTIRIEYYVKHPEEFKKEFQVLCANCNQIKRLENKECITSQ